MEPIETYVVFGSDPENPNKPLEVFMQQPGADQFLAEGLLRAFQAHLPALEPGGTLSMIITRGVKPTEEQPNPICTSGSFVINNLPDEKPVDRHVWDYHVERRQAVRIVGG